MEIMKMCEIEISVVSGVPGLWPLTKTIMMPDVCIIYWTIKQHQYSVVQQNELNHLAH